MYEWRNMDSAPRDGTPILTYSTGCDENESYLVVWWDDKKAERCVLGWCAYCVDHLIAADMWMPIPSKPEVYFE